MSSDLLHVEDIEQRKARMLKQERECWSDVRRTPYGGVMEVAGIDEAGRGPLAGPVVAAAVIFEPEFFIPEVNDSKVLSAEEREALYEHIIGSAKALGVGVVHHGVIDSINILQATYRAMHEAVLQLSITPSLLLIDGNRFQDIGIPFKTIVNGDALSFSIAAASIIAKVTRDRMMVEYDKQFPGYGFAKHKGYGTRGHREAIQRLGYCEIHRRSFAIKSLPTVEA